MPAGHDYRDTQEAKASLRLVCFYFEPSRMPGSTQILAPRLSFEDPTLADTALKVTRLIESTSCDIGAYFEAFVARCSPTS